MWHSGMRSAAGSGSKYRNWNGLHLDSHPHTCHSSCDELARPAQRPASCNGLWVRVGRYTHACAMHCCSTDACGCRCAADAQANSMDTMHGHDSALYNCSGMKMQPNVLRTVRFGRIMINPTSLAGGPVCLGWTSLTACRPCTSTAAGRHHEQPTNTVVQRWCQCSTWGCLHSRGARRHMSSALPLLHLLRYNCQPEAATGSASC
jgi:hypothetical protein